MRVRLAPLLAPLLIAATLATGGAAHAKAETWPVPTRADQPSDVDMASMSPDDFETQVMVAVNVARVANGLRPVPLFDSCTDRLSERWGERISSTGVFAHRDQNQVINRCHNSWAGETLIRGEQLTPESMVKAWLDSPPHRAILLSTRAQRAGVAVVPDADGRLIGVINLVRPGTK